MKFTFEEITKVLELSIAFIGLLLVNYGWIVPYKQSKISIDQQRKFERSMLSARWKKELIDKQISSLYGPVAELLREQALRKNLIKLQIGRNSIFQEDKYRISDLEENEQKIWVHFIDTYSIPTLKKVLEIIQCNQHLIYKSEIPECFYVFMEYVIGWELLDNQKRNGVQNFYEYYYSYNYPDSFNHYIENTLSILLHEQKELIEPSFVK